MLGSAEKAALQNQAIADARQQTKNIHLAYLQCYARNESNRNTCYQQLKHNSKGRNDATTWEYIRAFDNEAVKLGFAAFLEQHKHPCTAVTHLPQFNFHSKIYSITCTNNTTYTLQFDKQHTRWRLIP